MKATTIKSLDDIIDLAKANCLLCINDINVITFIPLHHFVQYQDVLSMFESQYEGNYIYKVSLTSTGYVIHEVLDPTALTHNMIANLFGTNPTTIPNQQAPNQRADPTIGNRIPNPPDASTLPNPGRRY